MATRGVKDLDVEPYQRVVARTVGGEVWHPDCAPALATGDAIEALDPTDANAEVRCRGCGGFIFEVEDDDE